MKEPTKCCSNPNCTSVNPQSVFEFSLDRRILDGLQSRCKTCRKLYDEEHKEEKRQRNKLYNETHREENRQYREAHREESRQYREAHREERRQYREVHKEEIAIKQRKKYFDRRDTQDFINIMVAINIVNEKLTNKKRSEV